MQISIIIPIYKVEKYIEKCVKSVITQTFTDYEVVLVDDKSPDNALQIAEKLLQENNIEFQSIKHNKNKSLSEARNSGLKVAKGKYIMFIDSDDELSHNEVLTQFYKTIEREKADFVTANFKVIYSETDIRIGKGNIECATTYQGSEILENFLQEKFSMSSWNKLINKDFLLKNQLFFVEDLRSQDELHTFQMCIVANKCCCLPYFNYNYYKVNVTSITKNKSTKTYDDNLFILTQQLAIAKEQQLINNKNANAFIYHFKRMSRKITPNKLLINKHLRGGITKKSNICIAKANYGSIKKCFVYPQPLLIG